MKTILVPTDFSECSENALRLAATIAEKSKSRIKLLHVYERPVYGFVDIYVDNLKNNNLKKDILKKLKKMASMSFLKGIEVDQLLIWDIDIWKIFNTNHLKDVDLIVMGTHGVSGLSELVLGSNAEKVVLAANLPVICVKNNSEKLTFRDIIFASDFSEEAVNAFGFVRSFANIFVSKIHLLKINTPEKFETTRESMNGIKIFLNKINAKKDNYPIYVYNDFHKEAGIIHFANDVKADLIALGTHGRNRLSRFFDSSISKGLVNHSSLPVLTTNVSKEKEQEKILKDIS